MWILEGHGSRKAIFSVGVQRGHFFAFFRVIIYRNVAMLLKPSLSWLGRAGARETHSRYTICPRHRHLPGTKVMPGYKFGGKTPAFEICFLFGKTIKLLLSDRVSVISFPGFGYFFLNRELFPIVRLHIYILLHLIHIWIFGWGNPYPPSENLPKCLILGSYRAIKRPFFSSILRKKTLIKCKKRLNNSICNPFYVIRSFPRFSLS